jgi:SHS2 domain-containing protein
MFKIIDHTADVGIDVSARSLKELFIEAARGWKYSVVENSPTDAKEEKRIRLSAPTLEELMVVWLNELNFFLTTKEWVLNDVVEGKINSIDSNWELDFFISGETLDYKKHEIIIEIKSVTYHQLIIQKSENQYKTRIIFDI